MSINKVTHLRSFIADQLQNLVDGKIKPEEANSCAMLAANMLLSIRLEMEYSRLQNKPPSIDFMETNQILIEGKKIK